MCVNAMVLRGILYAVSRLATIMSAEQFRCFRFVVDLALVSCEGLISRVSAMYTTDGNGFPQ